MKVMHLLQSNRFSGAENVVCQIISMCKDENIEFVYCSQNGQIKEALDVRKIKYNLTKDFSISEIRRVIKEENPDIIHAHDMKASFYAALCCGKIPLISHVHNNNYDSRGFSLKSILYYLAGKKAKHIFWVSKSSYNGYKFHEAFKDKSTVLYNIIDIEALKKKALLDVKVYDYEVVYLGRLTEQKNPKRLLKVFEKITERRPETKIVMIGTGEMENKIKELLMSNKKLSNIKFLGFNSNPYKILANSKVMIMTSRWEGTPMCALEALSMGVPIVSTPTDGLVDLIDSGENGYLSDDDEKLAEKICDILTNKELYKKLSENAKVKMKRMMDIQKYKTAILKQYRILE